MNFKEEIKNYNFSNSPFIIKMGLTPVIVITPNINEINSHIIAQYISNVTESSFLININETNLEENFKPLLLNIINNQNIKLIINLIIGDQDNGFDVTVKTSKNLNAIFQTIKTLNQNFNQNNIKSIYNKNYQEIFKYNSVDVIQIEINPTCTNLDHLENISKSLIDFIVEYMKN